MILIIKITKSYSSSDWYNFKIFSILHVWLNEILENMKTKKYEVFKDLSFEVKEIIISYCLRLLTQSTFLFLIKIYLVKIKGERKIEGYKHYKEKNILLQLHKEYNEVFFAINKT